MDKCLCVRIQRGVQIFQWGTNISFEKLGSGRGFSAVALCFRLLAVLLSVFFSQMQAHIQGLWVLCAEMGVAWHILGAGEVSEP